MINSVESFLKINKDTTGEQTSIHVSLNSFYNINDSMMGRMILAKALLYPGCQRLFIRGFRFWSSLRACLRLAADQAPRHTREKPLVLRVALL